MIIAQNGPALQRTAQQLSEITNLFEREYNQMFQELQQNLGTSDETSKIWYGPRAAGCLREALKGKPSFENMGRDLHLLEETITNQAETWGRQQNKKY